MDAAPAAKRRRVVTTCSECHRRKQKCDRRKPCNICLARSVPDRCSYSDVGPRQTETSEASSDENVRTVDTQVQNDGSVSPPSRAIDIAEQIGYSPLKGSNAFIELQYQLFKDETTGGLGLASTAEGTVKPEEWENRFWKVVGGLPSKPIIENLLDIFSSELNWYNAFFERYYLQQLYKSWQELVTGFAVSKQPLLKNVSRDVLYFPALVFQVCAVALHFMPPDSPALKLLSVNEIGRRYHLSEKYSDQGMEIMDTLGRHRPTITAVQHDLIRALWLKDCGRGTESWHALSNSIRQAQELNMHRQARVDQGGTVPETLSRLWYDEYRRRLWVILFVWDSHMSSMLGRPRMINVNDCDIQIPIDCNFADDPSVVVPTAIRTGGENETPSIFSGHLFRYSIANLIHEVKASGANRRNPKDYNAIQSLHEKAVALMDGLPAFLRFQNPDTSWDTRFTWIPRQREQALNAGTSFLLALHRPHIHTSPKSRKAAIQAAITILDSQQRTFETTKPYQYKFFGLAFFTIDAGFFLSSTTIMYPSTDREFSRKVDVCLQQGIKRLELLENHNAIAGSSLKLLRHCYQLLQEAASSRENIALSTEPVHEGPETIDQPTESHQAASQDSTGFENFHPLGFHTHNFPEQIQFPSTADLTGFPNINEFDSSYWIEQMNQIPFVAVDNPNIDSPWDFSFH
ncbi:hypothetical protein EG329_006260 [Mollisiaceae sp. DMI_Dod_QoI]|nr:hypothetical protein EG329_006260 [Helotiales sp. DMI_Dod_QoI]